MKWNEIRTRYPKKWLVVEALKARAQANQRVLLRLAVLGSFATSQTALKKYAEFHREIPQREMYVVGLAQNPRSKPRIPLIHANCFKNSRNSRQRILNCVSPMYFTPAVRS